MLGRNKGGERSPQPTSSNQGRERIPAAPMADIRGRVQAARQPERSAPPSPSPEELAEQDRIREATARRKFLEEQAAAQMLNDVTNGRPRPDHYATGGGYVASPLQQPQLPPGGGYDPRLNPVQQVPYHHLPSPGYGYVPDPRYQGQPPQGYYHGMPQGYMGPESYQHPGSVDATQLLRSLLATQALTASQESAAPTTTQITQITEVEPETTQLPAQRKAEQSRRERAVLDEEEEKAESSGGMEINLPSYTRMGAIAVAAVVAVGAVWSGVGSRGSESGGPVTAVAEAEVKEPTRETFEAFSIEGMPFANAEVAVEAPAAWTYTFPGDSQPTVVKDNPENERLNFTVSLDAELMMQVSVNKMEVSPPSEEDGAQKVTVNPADVKITPVYKTVPIEEYVVSRTGLASLSEINDFFNKEGLRPGISPFEVSAYRKHLDDNHNLAGQLLALEGVKKAVAEAGDLKQEVADAVIAAGGERGNPTDKVEVVFTDGEMPSPVDTYIAQYAKDLKNDGPVSINTERVRASVNPIDLPQPAKE